MSKLDEIAEKKRILSAMQVAAACGGLKIMETEHDHIIVRNSQLDMDFKVSIEPLVL